MPTGKARLPLKKVRINENLNTSLYYKNRSQLGLLPKLFLYCFLAAMLIIPLWHFNILNVQAFFKPEFADLNSEKSSPSSLVLQTQETQEDTHTNESENVPAPSSNSILIENETGVKCYLSYSSNQKDIKPLVTKNPEGWWLPSTCHYSKLRAIQIIRLNQDEAAKLGQRLNPANVQSLDGIDTYAIAYTQNDDTLPYGLEKYIKSLTLPVFTDRFYFNTSSAFETKRIGRYTYYLDGNCQGALVNDPCKFWRGDNNTGTIELLKKNVGLTGKGEVNELKQDLILKFATKQDYSTGVNLILLDQKTQNYKLLRIDQAQWKVYETINIPTSDSLYSIYYL